MNMIIHRLNFGLPSLLACWTVLSPVIRWCFRLLCRCLCFGRCRPIRTEDWDLWSKMKHKIQLIMNCKWLKYYYLSYKKTAWANFHITHMNTCQIKIYKLSLYTLVQNSVHGFCKYTDMAKNKFDFIKQLHLFQSNCSIWWGQVLMY